MIFIANPYEVEIWEGGKKTHSLEINDASSSFRAIKLDKLEDQVISLVNKMSEYSDPIKEISEKYLNTDYSKLDPKYRDALEKQSGFNKQLRLLNAQFLRLLIVDVESKESIVDSIKGQFHEPFFAAVKRASLGLADGRTLEKKKRKNKQFVISKSQKSSSAPGTKKKR